MGPSWPLSETLVSLCHGMSKGDFAMMYWDKLRNTDTARMEKKLLLNKCYGKGRVLYVFLYRKVEVLSNRKLMEKWYIFAYRTYCDLHNPNPPTHRPGFHKKRWRRGEPCLADEPARVCPSPNPHGNPLGNVTVRFRLDF